MRVIGLAGWSGSGKTTLLTKVIPQLLERGLTVSTLKHAHHEFDIDQPGKDSHAHRLAGATEVLVASATRWALMHELRGAPEPALSDLLAKLSPVDLVIVEGFKAAPHAKVEIYRAAIGKPPLHERDEWIAGIISDTAFPHSNRPVVSLSDIAAAAALMVEHAEPIETIRARAAVPPLVTSGV
jgi:molybdopterin-guanine dinucleotide biosynthesis protein B